MDAILRTISLSTTGNEPVVNSGSFYTPNASSGTMVEFSNLEANDIVLLGICDNPTNQSNYCGRTFLTSGTATFTTYFDRRRVWTGDREGCQYVKCFKVTSPGTIRFYATVQAGESRSDKIDYQYCIVKS